MKLLQSFERLKVGLEAWQSGSSGRVLPSKSEALSSTPAPPKPKTIKWVLKTLLPVHLWSYFPLKIDYVLEMMQFSDSLL
jgi:hypothetical protein